MTVAERAAFFPSAAGTLFGILAAPERARVRDVAVVVLPGGTPGGMRGQNGVAVRLARAVAGAGCASFRFDYHGIGESTGPTPHLRRDAPLLDDLDAAFDWLRNEGYRRFVVVGSCFGAQTALLAVAGRPEICGVALLACLVAAENERATPPSQLVVQSMAAAATSAVAVLVCYGTDDPQYAEFEAARPLGLQSALDSESVEVQVLDGRVHSFLDVDLQPVVIEAVTAWAGRVTP